MNFLDHTNATDGEVQGCIKPTGADGVIVVYDASTSKSVGELKKWVKAVRKWQPRNCHALLVGTKLDLVPASTGKKPKPPPCRAKAGAMAKSGGMRHTEVSAADEEGSSVADAISGFLEALVGQGRRPASAPAGPP